MSKPGKRPSNLKKIVPSKLQSTLPQQNIEQLLNTREDGTYCASDDTSCKYIPVETITDPQKMIQWIHYNPSATFFNTMSDKEDAKFCNMKDKTVELMFDKLPNEEAGGKSAFFGEYPNKIAEGGQELYTQCGIYCKDSQCDMLPYVQAHAGILRGHCEKVHVLKPGVEGLYNNYNLFTTKVQKRLDNPEQEEVIDTGFAIQDMEMCATRLKLEKPNIVG